MSTAPPVPRARSICPRPAHVGTVARIRISSFSPEPGICRPIPYYWDDRTRSPRWDFPEPSSPCWNSRAWTASIASCRWCWYRCSAIGTDPGRPRPPSGRGPSCVFLPCPIRARAPRRFGRVRANFPRGSRRARAVRAVDPVPNTNRGNAAAAAAREAAIRAKAAAPSTCHRRDTVSRPSPTMRGSGRPRISSGLVGSARSGSASRRPRRRTRRRTSGGAGCRCRPPSAEWIRSIGPGRCCCR
mmetsp:Transcript_36495/g.87996  ORF Transcript_36495/g.87996 Transcript_36495/m.87996 type:complete len:243 (-) Transcript_36495:227-955(-)